MPILLLPPRITEDSVKLWRAAVAEKWETLRLDRWRAPEGLEASEVAVYGGYFIALAKDLGISLLVPSNDFLTKLPREFRGRDVELLTLAEARGVDRRAFYKPADDKCFLAKVYGSGAELPAKGELPDDVPVLISEVIRWRLEFRCFVHDRKMVTLSPYLRDHARVETEEGAFPASDSEFADARSFVEKLLAVETVALPPAVVIDVGLTEDRGWAVIEANQVWGAGIYGCDARGILPLLRRVCVATAGISESDRRWSAAV